ncbi:MAG: relaxase/mobilization nuclease domain-containing protein [Deltaproteobacteria bacterium]|jgi:hypothetical protein|nr:relaxase/mobilization nuclease domain-containing protein [Deltaproteobacteria bacterium]
MIAKITKGRSFFGLLKYLMTEGKDPAMVGGSMGADDLRGLWEEFRSAASLRPGIARPVWHCSLSLPAGDALSDAAWGRAAKDFMRGMGFPERTPYVVFRHHDTAYDHVHIAASRIGWDGALWSDSFDFRKSVAVCARLEQEYGLQIVARLGSPRGRKGLSDGEKRMSLREGQEPVREALQGTIDYFFESVAAAGSRPGAPPGPQPAAARAAQARAGAGTADRPEADSPDADFPEDDFPEDFPPDADFPEDGFPEDFPPDADFPEDYFPEDGIPDADFTEENVEAGDATALPSFVFSLAECGIETRLAIGDSGDIHGISFMLNGHAFAGHALGTDYTWQGLLGRGITYDPARDLAALRESFGAAPQAKAMIKEWIDALLPGGRVTGTDFALGLRRKGVVVLPDTAGGGRLVGLTFWWGGMSFPAAELWDGYGLEGLRKRGLVLGAGSFLDEVKAMAAESAAEIAAAPYVPLRDKLKAGVGLGRALAEAITHALPEGQGARIEFPEFVGRMREDGVRVVPNIQLRSGGMRGISFAADGEKTVNGSDVPGGFSWAGLVRRGVDYDAARDREILAELGVFWDPPAEAGAPSAPGTPPGLPGPADRRAAEELPPDLEAEPFGPEELREAEELPPDLEAELFGPEELPPDLETEPFGPEELRAAEELPPDPEPIRERPAPAPAPKPLTKEALCATLKKKVAKALGPRDPANPDRLKGPLPLITFIDRMAEADVFVLLNMHKTGRISGISFKVIGHAPVKGSEIIGKSSLSESTGWNQLAAAGVAYDPRSDHDAVHERVSVWQGHRGDFIGREDGAGHALERPGAAGGHGPSAEGHGASAGGHGPSAEGHGASAGGHGRTAGGHGQSAGAPGASDGPAGALASGGGGAGVPEESRRRPAPGGGREPGIADARGVPLAGGPEGAGGGLQAPGVRLGEADDATHGGRAVGADDGDGRDPESVGGSSRPCHEERDTRDRRRDREHGSDTHTVHSGNGRGQDNRGRPQAAGSIHPGFGVHVPDGVGGVVVWGHDLLGDAHEREAVLSGRGERAAPGPYPVWEPDRFRFPGYACRGEGGCSLYFREGSGEPAFADRGAEIEVFSDEVSDALVATVLGQRKWGYLSLRGSDDFLTRCMALAGPAGANVDLTPEVCRAVEGSGYSMGPALGADPGGPAPDPRARAFYVGGFADGDDGSVLDGMRRMADADGNATVCGPRGIIERFAEVARRFGYRLKAFLLDTLDIAITAGIRLVFSPGVLSFFQNRMKSRDSGPGASPAIGHESPPLTGTGPESGHEPEPGPPKAARPAPVPDPEARTAPLPAPETDRKPRKIPEPGLYYDDWNVPAPPPERKPSGPPPRRAPAPPAPAPAPPPPAPSPEPEPRRPPAPRWRGPSM